MLKCVLRGTACLGVALLLVACGEDDPDSSGSTLSAATAASFEGVYELSARTENETSCDAEGASQLDATKEKLFVLVARTVFGQQSLELVSCKDTADCQGKVSQIRNVSFYGYEYSASLSSEVSADKLSGFTAWTGIERDGKCVERKYTEYTLTRDGNTVRLETRTKALADRPPEDGFCTVSPAESQKEAQTAPCKAYETLSGTRSGNL